MTTTEPTTTGPTPGPITGSGEPVDDAAVGAFVERLFEATVAAVEQLTIHVGVQLGLYDRLADGRARSAAELAAEAGIDRRYAREWLEQQAVAGFLQVASDGVDGPDPDRRTYTLPPAHAEVLTNRDSLAYLAPLARLGVGAAMAADAIVDAYRTGEGLPFGAFGEHVRAGVAAANRPHFLQLMGTEWLPAMPDVVARLQADPPATVADVGCGVGWSTIALARAFPRIRVHGFDLDAASIEEARRAAEAEGVADRVTFEVRDAADAAPGAYDLVCMFEALHDTGRPADVLAALRIMAGPSGTVFVMDERTEDTFTAPGSPTERFLYAASTVHCLLVGRSDPHDHATGTVLRPSMLEALARQAGFRATEVLPIEHESWRFYRLRP